VASATDILPNAPTHSKSQEISAAIQPCPDDMPLLLKIILAKEEESDDDVDVDDFAPDDSPTKNPTITASTANDEGKHHSSQQLRLRHLPLTAAIATLSTYDLLNQLGQLDEFRRRCDNLYQRVRALFFLYAAHRFHLPERRKAVESGLEDGVVFIAEEELGGCVGVGKEEGGETTVVCPKGYAALLDRRFHEAIDHFFEFNARPTSKAIAILPSDKRHATCTANSAATEYSADENDKENDYHSFHPSNSTKNLLPGRTSLISNLSYSRSPSSATEVTAATTADSMNSSYYRYSHSTRTYSNLSNFSTSSNSGYFLEGENISHSFHGFDYIIATRENSEIENDNTNAIDTQQAKPTTTTITAPILTTNPQPKPLLLPSDATSSALAKAYRSLAFQTLADQVKSSVRSHPGNEWMFRVTRCSGGADAENVGVPSSAGNENDVDGTEQGICHPLKWREDLLEGVVGGFLKEQARGAGPILVEKTPVRMDVSHSCWSDIFFLGMDFPEGARVINCSVDLAVQRKVTSHDGTHAFEAIEPTPPIECKLQLTTTNPGTIKLTSTDLKASVTLTHVSQAFNFAADYLGLLKAGLVASGIVPLGLEKRCEAEGDIPLNQLLSGMMPRTADVDENARGECRYGLELTTNVKNIPKGSRLAVSTNLLGSIIAIGMRATNQTDSLVGPLLEAERRLVAARAILGEWLGGSGGGWQDSGGVWPGLKLIHGVKAKPGDPEYGISRGRLLPDHVLLDKEQAPPSLLEALEKSLVLVHGGMAQNVGSILDMTTEKYLLREYEEWCARHRAMGIFDEILAAFRKSDVKTTAKLVTENFFGPIRTVIPWATNLYTETLIERTQMRFGDKLWGFWMLGGASGGGMGFIFDPDAKQEALSVMGDIMLQTKREMEHSLPFAMDPVVFDYRVNDKGTVAELLKNGFSNGKENETTLFTGEGEATTTQTQTLDELLKEQGFDMKAQEQIRSDLRNGVIGLAKNRLSLDSELTDVTLDDVIIAEGKSIPAEARERGLAELSAGTVGVVTLAAGIGSRWTQGAGVVKAIHPYCCLGGKHRTFLEVHLAKNRRVSKESGISIPHVYTTSWMTDEPIRTFVKSLDISENELIYISKGRSIGLRMIPMVRDLKFLWEEQSQQKLDEQAQKVRENLHAALMGWAKSNGEGSDYRDNVPKQCLCPVGHWYEVPNLLLNGTLAKMLRDRPQLKTLMVHNIDTIGADVDAGILGMFLNSSSTLAYEVVPRRIEDMGGGLCRVNGKPRLVEGLALPREEDELKSSYYNSLTTWVDIDKLLLKFGLNRGDILEQSDKIPEAINNFSRRLPTYVTIKEVKKRWGGGQEDVYPVAQFEKLWGDMGAVDDINCSYFVVSRDRGQQLKDPAQLDGWSRDGSAAHLDSICLWKDNLD